MRFNLQEFPFDQFKNIGLEKTAVLGLPKRVLNALLSGNRTSLIRFNNIKSGYIPNTSLDAKLSLARGLNEKPVLKIHPVNHEAKNVFNLSTEETNLLATGTLAFIPKLLKDKNGKIQDCLISLDNTIKEYVAIKKSALTPPEKINGTPLTDSQKTDFSNGKEIAIGKEKYQLDPNNETGITDNKNNSTLNALQFKHSGYTSLELMIDMALLTSGLGSSVLLEHLANFTLHSSAATAGRQLNDKPLREQLAKAGNQMQQENKLFSAEEVKSIVAHHLGRPVELSQLNDIDNNKEATLNKAIDEIESITPTDKITAGDNPLSLKEKMDNISTNIKY